MGKYTHIVVGGIGLAVLYGALQTVAALTAVKLDDDTLCPKNREIGRHIVFLVDQTDPLTGSQKDYLLNRVRGARSELKRFDKVSIYTIEDQGKLPEIRFSLCNPGSKADLENDWWLSRFNTASWWERDYTEKFEAPLLKVADDLTQATSLAESHITATISLVSRTDGFTSDLSNRRLIVLSDLLENTSAYSQYAEKSGGDLSLDRFQAAGSGPTPDLAGAEVEIVYLARDNGQKVQSEKHLDFWRSYFKQYGASTVTVVSPWPVR